MLNVSKSHLEPVQHIAWLGFNVDLLNGCFCVPPDKMERLKSAIACVPMRARVSARSLASIVGQIISMSLPIGPVA